MDIDIRIIEKLTYPDDKDLLDAALSILLHKSDQNNQHIKSFRELTRCYKSKVNKIYEFLTNAAFAYRQKGDQGAEGLQQALEKSQFKSHIFDILKTIEFDKTLNNYRLIKMKGNEGENKKLIQQDFWKESSLNNFVRLEWKIEIILSSMVIRKVKKLYSNLT